MQTLCMQPAGGGLSGNGERDSEESGLSGEVMLTNCLKLWVLITSYVCLRRECVAAEEFIFY